MSSSFVSDPSNPSRSIRTNSNENDNKRVTNVKSIVRKSCSVAVPIFNSKNSNFNNSANQNCSNEHEINNNLSMNSEYSPRVARSFYKNDSSFEETSQPSSFTSSYLLGEHKKHRNHFYSHYVNGLVSDFRLIEGTLLSASF